MIKTRIFPEHNYKSIYFNGKTIRIAIDPKKPITELKQPEFFDVKITGSCAGNCEYCYMSSESSDSHYDNIIEKTNSFFGTMSDNDKPYQVAIGGGEPTLHPEFINVLKTFYDLGITPNYTTNGMHINSKIIDATTKYCGGVAVSCHPHLITHWTNAAELLSKAKTQLNFHIIISDKESVDYFRDIYDKWKDKVKYFVLLPYGAQGRAKPKKIEWEYLLTKMPEDATQIAFGANFYPYLQNTKTKFKISLYEPEIMSKFLDYKDMSIHKSSFNLNN